jgi:hypothetical protein
MFYKCTFTLFLVLKYLSTSVASVDPVFHSLSLLAAGPQRRRGETARIVKNVAYVDVRPNPPFSLSWLVADM